MRLPLLLLAPLLLAAAPANEPAAPTTTPPTAPSTRPAHDRDPWIFRCVLDGNARTVVVSLGDHHWAAYDAAHCALEKFWEGDVELTGAVYDMRHGPQPKAKGKVLLDRAGAVTHPTQTITGLTTGDTAKTSATVTTPPPDTDVWNFAYRGYSISGDVATFHYANGDGPAQLRVNDAPSMTTGSDGQPVFRRTFTTSDKANATVSLPTSESVAKILLTNGQVFVGSERKLVKAPAEIPFDASKNVDVALDAPQVIIDTEFKPADQQPTNTAK